MRVYHCDRYEIPLPAGHRFPASKYRLLRERLVAEGVVSRGELEASEPIDPAPLLLAHTPRYVDAVLEGRLDEAEQRRLGFPNSEGLQLRSRASVQGTLSAARAALVEGIAGNLAGGTHHAFADHGEGFCVFNDFAVTIRLLQREGEIQRAAVIDLDVHQGNGNAALFEGDDSVFTFSMHGEKNFPFRKHRSSLDIGLPDGTGDAAYLAALAEHLPGVLDRARPELILYQAGVDPLAEDTLGRLSLTQEGLRRRDRLVLQAARDRDVPIVLTLGGGYARPVERSIDAHVGTYREARDAFAV